MKINEVAKLTGITIRTLHYYDQIGLLKPDKTNENGYRSYDDDDLAVLQQILFFRELDFPLSEIKKIISDTCFNKNKALENHKTLLIEKRKRINKLIQLVDKTIKGDDNMSFKEFNNTNFAEIKNKYAKEAKELYGNTPEYAESEEKTKSYKNEDWEAINQESNKIFKEFSFIMDQEPSSQETQVLVRKWQDFISQNFYKCSNEILAGLGQMYVTDSRFTQNIDKHGKGLARFISDAIKVYCS